MKKLCILLISVLSAQCPCPPLDTCAPTNCAYLPASRRCQLTSNCLENADSYVLFDFLWWETTERGLEFASKNTRASFNQDIQIYEPDFSFGPAFRIGLGTHLNHDNWDLEFTYTRYYTHTLNHAYYDFGGNPNGGIRSIWTSSVAFLGNNFHTLWQDVEAKWKIHANLFDLFLKQRLCLSPAITIEPALGIKMALLQQRYKVIYQNGNTTDIDVGNGPEPIQFISSTIGMNNRSLNFGPTATILTKWNLWDHFDFLGGISGSLLAARFSIGRNEFDVSSTTQLQFDSLIEEDAYWTFRPQAAATFGIGWTECICRPKSVLYYGFSASYEALVYWKQNMLYRYIDQSNAAMIAPTQGDLFFHGLTLDAFVDF